MPINSRLFPQESQINIRQNSFHPSFSFEIHNITDLKSGHDLQSAASPQQLWYDVPTNTLNAVFITSQQQSVWIDRTSTYFYSTDQGINWINVGNIPDPSIATSGFPSIIGLTSGNIIIANHTILGGIQLRSQLFINSFPGQYDFLNYDPGITPEGNPIHPKLGRSKNNLVLFSALSIGTVNLSKNSFDILNGTFGGYSSSPGGSLGGYSYATSNAGKIGLAYIDGQGSAWFTQSEDEGLTWNLPLRIYIPFEDSVFGYPVSHGTFRGISAAYLGESPKILFEVYCLLPNVPSSWYPRLPSEIYFWSPDINGGQAFAIADTNNIPFIPNEGSSSFLDFVASIARPVIGVDQGNTTLFSAFYASTEDISTFANIDSTRIYAGYFMMSENGGETWTVPERFTPINEPPLDWRWISIAQVNPVSGNTVNVHLVAVGDPVAGVNGIYFQPPMMLTAQFYHFSKEITLTDVAEEPQVNHSFYLFQNYPNPFNPKTNIEFRIANSGFVSLKVYDVLGNEIATLVNEEKPAGKYEVEFDAESLTSGIYFYKLQAGDYNQTRKMILLK